MRLSLSSAAAPDAALADLLSACARRGLTGLELVQGHAHGVAGGLDAARAGAVRAAAGHAGVTICASYRQALDEADLERAARLAAALDAPLVVPVEGVATSLVALAARTFQTAGSRLLLAHGTDPSTAEQLRQAIDSLPQADSLGLAWEVRPGRDAPGRVADVLAIAGPRLRYVRLHGGGPETAQQTGLGVGALMARLTLARYAGPLVLTPSTARYHHAWRAWLGRVGGWGCGSKQSDASLVTL